MADWPRNRADLIAEQERLAGAEVSPWRPGGEVAVGGCWVCFPRGLSGVGARGDPAWAAAVVGDEVVRDHPRRAGLALHLGAVVGVPTVGVTHRPLLAAGESPEDRRGAWAPLVLDGEVVGAWLRTRRGRRPLAVDPGWRTDLEGALEVVLDMCRVRTPEPLRRARSAARRARAG